MSIFKRLLCHFEAGALLVQARQFDGFLTLLKLTSPFQRQQQQMHKFHCSASILFLLRFDLFPTENLNRIQIKLLQGEGPKTYWQRKWNLFSSRLFRMFLVPCLCDLRKNESKTTMLRQKGSSSTSKTKRD